MSEERQWFCIQCGKPVRHIYCSQACREKTGEAQRLAREERARQLREAWAKDPEGMKAKLQAARAAKRAPAEEGA